MSLKKSVLIISAILLASSVHTFAAPAKHKIIAPACLLKAAAIQPNKLARKGDLQLIELDKPGIIKLAETKHQTQGICGGFMDVTREWNEDSKLGKLDPASFLAKQTAVKTPKRKEGTVYKIKYQNETESLLKTISPSLMWNNLTTLTNFDDRYADSDNGVAAAKWIKEKIESIASETGHADVTVYYVKTGDNWSQPSVVAKFGNSNEPGIVIGGHMDTLDSNNSKKPGADDDGSGSVTVMETARTLLASGMSFKKPIYFIWYSAEEMGLIGSGYVVADFKKKKIPVAAVIQMDMTGYENKNQSNTMWLITDHVNLDLTNFLKDLITTYVKEPVKTSMCGYSCSDHAQWDKAGFPAAFPFETEMNKDNPDIHTSRDTMDRLSLNHMTNFVKLGTAFAVELAEPAAK